jgi:hypothetical protein
MRRSAGACPGLAVSPWREAALHSNWDTTLGAAGLPKGMASMYTEPIQGNNTEILAQWGVI